MDISNLQTDVIRLSPSGSQNQKAGTGNAAPNSPLGSDAAGGKAAAGTAGNGPNPSGGISLESRRSAELKKEEAAVQFEEIFAKQLVKEMTKDSFKMADTNGVMGGSNNLYRKYITDTLAGELAQQRKLGMADMVTRYWDHKESNINEK